jgi:DNA mismatch repair protein MutL
MARIRLLDSRTIDRIAAGEVVERPASVVKELVENALDAGAKRIEIETERGGVASIVVRDDGSGMGPEDAAMCVERHATSKIETDRDLAAVTSFGFRGEALPSIAAVAKLRLTTSDGTSAEAVRVEVDWGGRKRLEPAAGPRGTEVRVEALFEKTPARRKFLKTPEAESREIARVVTRAAIANPAVAFSLRSDGREALAAAPAAGPSERIVQIFGAETVGDLLPFSATSGEYRLNGWVTRGAITFASRRLQFLFVNGRPVVDRGVMRAIQEAARNSIRTARHPGVFLFFSAPAGGVDVNVSPSKTEVRFSAASEIYRLVFHGIGSALEAGKDARRLAPVSGGPASDFSVAEARQVYAAPPAPNTRRPGRMLRLEVDAPGQGPPAVVEVEVEQGGPIEAIGQYDSSFLLAAGESGLLVIDQHAAHERVLYERICERSRKGSRLAQALLEPAVFEASPEEALQIEQLGEELDEAGFSVEARSGRVFAIATVPAEASGRDAARMLRDILAVVGAPGRGPDIRRDRIAATVACRSAITVHHRLSREEMNRLLADWTRCRDRFTCPHGRPSVLSLSDADLYTFFKRS